ncbi:MAG: hypothetical protein EOP84_28610, partial [Verrucomicrobiaceae bacterium]
AVMEKTKKAAVIAAGFTWSDLGAWDAIWAAAPKVGGENVVSGMAFLKDTPGLQGIALSGYGMEDDIARSHASGFALHLTKPIDIKALDRAIARVSSEKLSVE